MTQIARIANTLKKSKSARGLTTAKIAAAARVPVDAVRKRVYDLKKAGHSIVSNVETVKGERLTFYKYA